MPTPKRPKFDREMRDNRVTELIEVIVDLTKRIAIKESRCQQAEIAHNYKLCDQLSEDIMELKSEKRQNEKELLFFKKKEKRSVRYQEVKCRKLSESPDTASRSGSTTPGLALHLFHLSLHSNYTGSYSCDASASSESESTVMSPPYTGPHRPVTRTWGGGILIMCRPLIPSSLSHTKSVVIFKTTNMITCSFMFKNVKRNCSIDQKQAENVYVILF